MKQVMIPVLMLITILGFVQELSSAAPYTDHLNFNHNQLNQNTIVQVLETTLVDDREISRSKFDLLLEKRPALSEVVYYITSLKFEKKESDPVLPEIEDLDYRSLIFKKYNS